MSVFKKPVHKVLIKPTHIDKLTQEGRLPESLEEKPPLPKEEKQSKTGLVKFKKQSFNIPNVKEIKEKSLYKAKLNVVRNELPAFEEDEIPPCDSCKTAACCSVFVIELTEEEYKSGLYDDVAIELSPEAMRQLESSVLSVTRMGAPLYVKGTTQYYLEGKAGEPCPYLDDNNLCSIYDERPLVCRAYTCIGDDRITQGMRDGTEPLEVDWWI